MFNKSIRNQENEKIANVLKQLVSITYIPENWNVNHLNTLTLQLNEIQLDLNTILTLDSRELLPFLQKLDLDFANYELFADFLVGLSNKMEEHRNPLKEKAIILYNSIQEESRNFSFEIFNKIALIKKL